MIARHRGDARIHSRWRPLSPAASPPRPIDRGAQELPGNANSDAPIAGKPRRARAPITLATMVGVAVIAGQQLAHQTAGAPLPATPQQWVEQWAAASIDNPNRVCEELFAPDLAATFMADTGSSCRTYYRSVNSSSFRVRRILEDGDAATIEARQVAAVHNWGYFTIVLSHLDRGWQAIDIVPGGPVRPR
jgi:hypothetical protein